MRNNHADNDGENEKLSRKQKRQQKRDAKREREENRSIYSNVVRALYAPVAPWRSAARTISTTGISNEIGMLRRGLSARRTCPECNSHLAVGDVIEQDADGEPLDGSYRAFMCQSCGWHQSIDEALQEAKGSLNSFKSSEKQMLFSGLGIFLLFGLISLFNHSLFTVIGGSIIAICLLMFALFYRYRYWQVANERLFEIRPPIKDWLRDEMAR